VKLHFITSGYLYFYITTTNQHVCTIVFSFSLAKFVGLKSLDNDSSLSVVFSGSRIYGNYLLAIELFGSSHVV